MNRAVEAKPPIDVSPHEDPVADCNDEMAAAA